MFKIAKSSGAFKKPKQKTEVRSFECSSLAGRLPALRLLLLSSFLLFSTIALFSALALASSSVRVLTYDSLTAEGGLGAVLRAEFKAQCGADLILVSAGDSGQLVSRVKAESRLDVSKRAAAVLGVDVWTLPGLKDEIESAKALEPTGLKQVRAELILAPGFVPFDYGWMGWMVDTDALTKKKLPPPSSWTDLKDPRFQNLWVFSDPRLSTPGLFLLYALEQVFGEGTKAFLKTFRGLWFSVTPGWTQAYGLFADGKVPLAWSYGSSQAYHQKESPSSKRFRALRFKEGAPVHVEGAVALKDSSRQTPERERQTLCFFETLLSPKIQSAIPETQWMWPVRADTKLPSSFAGIPEPTRRIVPPVDADVSKRLLKLWRESR
jgi:thiamine transport system substrate-binding protein